LILVLEYDRSVGRHTPPRGLVSYLAAAAKGRKGVRDG